MTMRSLHGPLRRTTRLLTAACLTVIATTAWASGDTSGLTWQDPRQPSAASRDIVDEFLPDLSRLEESLLADADDGRLDEHRLVAAALIAGGVDRSDVLESNLRRWDALAAESDRLCDTADPPRQRARVIFEFLHRRVLRGGYQIDCTDLRVPLADGRFNCVSATVLYCCLAERHGLVAHGLEAPGHVLCRLALPEGPLDVETTCPRWLGPRQDSPQRSETNERPEEGGVVMESADDTPRRLLSDVQLIAMIYYNRGADLLARKQFALAVAANAMALRLDPASTAARGNLLASLNNWSVDLSTSGRFAEALEPLEQGWRVDDRYAPFATNFVHVHFRWIEQLIGQGRFAEALDRLEAAQARRPDEPFFEQARLSVRRHWARRNGPETARSAVVPTTGPPRPSEHEPEATGRCITGADLTSLDL
ncbi:MAG: hypothetical protein HQ581_24290 [Planctomycetes bacterium]|nr:hypothetical protein [Planctomycetota bacterium]